MNTIPPVRVALMALSLVVAGVPAIAQAPAGPDEIAGVIVNDKDVIVAGATVVARLDGIIRATTTTNQRGEFSLKNLAPGTYEVRVDSEGAETITLHVKVAGDGRGETLDLAASLRRSYKTIKASLTAAAEQMPPQGYADKLGTLTDGPTFAELLARGIQRQMALCSTLTGRPAPPVRVEANVDLGTKTRLIEALGRTVAMCEQALEGLTDMTATEMVRVGADYRPRAAVLANIIGHGYETAGATAAYLRARNVRPPSGLAVRGDRRP